MLPPVVTGKPASSAPFSIAAAGTPSRSIAMPSWQKVPKTREVKKPRASFTITGVLPICCTKS